MGKKIIPDEVRKKVITIVDKFNQKELQGTNCRYTARFRGKFLYLDRINYDKKEPVSRLEFLKETNDWKFAIFKWSSETYDPDEFFFQGRELVDGSIEGAMKAGMVAYPV
ncbi:MAG: hypothetical protein D3923_15720 [Candidatus Electrothrix sp. AR3]|nr:hypothetical protein [Candidatus Electrothrix sp. AR3]